MALSKSTFVVLIICLIANTKPPCDAAGRLVRVPLTRATTQKAGQVGQPVINYYTPVSIGTPPILFNIQPDLGFGDLFVPHYEWSPFKINLHYSKGFQCKSSATCVKTDRAYEIVYQQTKLTGKTYDDVMTFNGAHVGDGNTTTTTLTSTAATPTATATLPASLNVTAASPTAPMVSLRKNFLAISDASDARFKELPVDGYFGLGPSQISAAGVENLLIRLASAKFIDNLQFSLWLNPILDSPQGGELILGGVDPSRYQGQIYWHQLQVSSIAWSLQLQFVSLGSQYVSSQPRQAVLSSGVNEIYGPREEVQRIYNLLNTTHQSSGIELIDCRRIPNLPILTFSVDGIPYALLPTNYIRKTTDGYIFKTETCYVAILPSNDYQNQWTLGTNFLGAYYSIFDMTYRQIGFANLR